MFVIDFAALDERARAGDLSSTILLSLGSGSTGRQADAPHRLPALPAGGVGLARTPIRPRERLLIATPITFSSSKKRRFYCLWRGTKVFVAPCQHAFEVCASCEAHHL